MKSVGCRKKESTRCDLSDLVLEGILQRVLVNGIHFQQFNNSTSPRHKQCTISRLSVADRQLEDKKGLSHQDKLMG